MSTLLLLLAIEGGLFLLFLFLLLIHEVSNSHPQAFQVPKFKAPVFQPFAKTSFLGKLGKDIKAVWKPQEPEFFTSSDGNILYLSKKLTSTWKPEQVILFMLSQKQEFLDQLKTKDPAVFDALASLSDKLTTTNARIAFRSLKILPMFKKDMAVWKLPLIDMPVSSLADDLIVKESQKS